jgi:hypothetical protein
VNPNPTFSEPGTESGANAAPVRNRILGRVLGLRHFVLGVVLVQGWLGALVALGWAQRLARRSVLHTWWLGRPSTRQDLSFERFCVEDAATRDLHHWPRWILGEPTTPDRTRSSLAGRLLGGLCRNLVGGGIAAVGAFLLLGPSELFWATSWYAGWQNSFNKGYEHAWFGPSVFALGLVGFAAGMVLVPFALTRLAVTGRLRTVLEWRLLWRLASRRWAASAALASLLVLTSSAALVVKVLPGFFPQMDEARIHRLEMAGEPVPEALRQSISPTPSQALQRIQRYHLFAALGLFPAFLLGRVVAARLYAGAVVEGIRSGSVAEGDLDESEWQALRRLDLIHPRPVLDPPRWRRAARWIGSRSGRLLAGTTTVGLWLGLGALILVSEFLRYSGGGGGVPGRGWWNQPMLQVPWLEWTPGHLRNLDLTGDPLPAPMPSPPQKPME